jgi:hypothetical protein
MNGISSACIATKQHACIISLHRTAHMHTHVEVFTVETWHWRDHLFAPYYYSSAGGLSICSNCSSNSVGAQVTISANMAEVGERTLYYVGDFLLSSELSKCDDNYFGCVPYVVIY